MARARATLAAVAVAVLALPACAGPETAPDPAVGDGTTAGTTAGSPSAGSRSPSPPAPPSPSPSAAPATGEPTVDPALAVDPPGPRRGPIVPSDIIVVGQEPLSEETVAAVRRVEGVVDIEQFTLAQASVQNRVLDVALVDPATYRNFTPRDSAELQAAWDRVARGEIAVSDDLTGELPLDKQGFLRLGQDASDPLVHVGAYMPLTPLVEVVANEKWASEFDRVQVGNALLITTVKTAPQAVRKPLQRLLGQDVSLQLTDIASTEGIDPSTVQTAVLVGGIAEVVGRFNYRVIGGGRIAPDPAWVASHITTQRVPILGEVTCNRYLFPQLRAALREVVSRGLADEINPEEYAGCYYPRFIAGTTTLSNHSFGLALDINVPGNQRGTLGQIDRGVVAAFERWGFTWGGRWRYTDPMHFEMNRLVDPR